MSLMLAIAAQTALAADVIWLQPGSAEQVAAVTAAGGDGSNELSLLDLRAGGAAWTSADDEALDDLAAGLKAVREYETKLDGELVIMQDLAAPIAGVSVLRNESDRSKLFSALAYQGFAVNRFFEDDLATDERAADFVFAAEGVSFELPWVDAIAIEPERDITPYEIAEAPQRVAYGDRKKLLADQLPGLMVPGELPAGSKLYVDGRATEVPATGSVKVRPGRHLAHVELDGTIIARHDFRAVASKKTELPSPMSDADWQGFVDALSADDSPPLPPEVSAAVGSLGGEVWLARPGGKGVEVFVLTPGGVEPRTVELPRTGGGGDGDGSPLSLSAGIGTGWFMSDDFYLQNPGVVPRLKPSINVPAIGLTASADFDISMLRVGAGIDMLVPTGENSVAFTGDAVVRPRFHPHLAVGIPWAAATIGYMFPYHPALGLRGAVPIGPLEIGARGQVGVAGVGTRDNGTTHEFGRLYTAWLTIGFRQGL